MSDRGRQREALNGAATFFEEVATGENTAPLVFAQAIRRSSEDSLAIDALRALIAAIFFPNAYGVPTLSEAALLAAKALETIEAKND